jgi:tetratricopeptide (TPR) repeat protein
MRRRWGWRWALVVATLPLGAALARDGDARARAVVLFEEASALREAGRLDEACDKFQASLEALRGAGTLFNLADCREAQGRRREALGAFVEVAEMSRIAGDAERERVARARAKRLEEALAAEAAARAPPPVKAGPAPVSSAAADADDPDDGRTQRIVAIALGGVALVGIAVGAGFGLVALDKADAYRGHCDAANRCDPRGIELHDEAARAATISNVAFVAGAALGVAAVVVLLTAPSPEARGALASSGLGVRF